MPRRAARYLTPAATIAALAACVYLAYGPGNVGYDSAYALAWGEDLVEGETPDLERPFAPTPHPLANLLGALLAPLPGAALGAWRLVIVLAFAALGWVAYLLGRDVFGRLVGIAFASIVMTRSAFVASFSHASLDVLFFALVLAAVWAETVRMRPAAVAALLAVAGLIRPEAWLLLGAYAALQAWRSRRPARWALIAVAPALVWALADLALTGDPLHSLHGTRDLAAVLERPRSTGSAPELVSAYLVVVLGEAVAWGGAVACLFAIGRVWERIRVPTGVLLLGVAAFFTLALAGLPLLTRYVAVPALMLAFFFAAGLFGFVALRERGGRGAPALVAAGLAIALAVSTPSQLATLGEVRRDSERRNRVEDGLADLASRAEVARCTRVYVTGYRPVPQLLLRLPDGVSAHVWSEPAPAEDAAFVIPRTRTAAGYASLGAADVAVPPIPVTLPAVARNAHWTLLARCD